MNVETNSTKEEKQARIVEDFSARVRDLAEAVNLNATSLGARVGIPSSSASNYWKGIRPWPTEALVDLARELRTDVAYLLTGAIAGRVPEDALATARGALQAPGVRYKAEPGEQEIEELAEQLGLIKLAEVDLTLGMGHSYLDESAVTKTERWFPKEWVRQFTNAPAAMLSFVRPEGDSMYPTINDRDIVLLDHSVKHIDRQDAIWALSYGGLGTIRRVRQMPDGSYLMHADNPSVRPQPAHDDEMFVIARVAGVMRRT